MELNNVVVRLKNDAVLKGKTSDFFPNKTSFHLEKLDGKILGIEVEQLKAIFFVKDINGDENRPDIYDDTIKGSGKKIKCTFSDGESITGYTLGYSPDRHGFYMTPADLNGNNERIFVVKSATQNVEFL